MGGHLFEHPLSVSIGKQTSKSVLRCHSLSSEDKEGVKLNLKDIFLYNYIGRLDLSKSAFIIVFILLVFYTKVIASW